MAFHFHFFDGQRVPSIGLGTYAFKPQNKDKSEENNPDSQLLQSVEEIVRHAIGSAGYRHIDCAHAYNNEFEVGRGIRSAMTDYGIKRYLCIKHVLCLFKITSVSTPYIIYIYIYIFIIHIFFNSLNNFCSFTLKDRSCSSAVNCGTNIMIQKTLVQL